MAIMEIQNKDMSVPKRDEILQAMDSAKNSVDASKYLLQRIEDIVANSKFLRKSPDLMKEAQKVVAAVREFAEFVALQLNSGAQIWSGQLPETSAFKKIHSYLAEKAVEDLKSGTRFEKVRLDYAVSAEGHFVRGYASGEQGAKALDEEASASLDQLFNAWLAEKNIVTEEGNLYRKTDSSENQVRLNVNEVEKLMADPDKGFGKYLQNKGGIQLSSRQLEYPGENRLEQVRKTATAQTNSPS